MCQMLADNELLHWEHLEHSGDPSTWGGAEQFVKEELEVLKWVSTVGRQAPR